MVVCFIASGKKLPGKVDACKAFTGTWQHAQIQNGVHCSVCSPGTLFSALVTAPIVTGSGKVFVSSSAQGSAANNSM